jgi:cytochrome P450
MTETARAHSTTITVTEPVPLVPDLGGCPYAAYARLREGGGAHQAVMAEGLPAWVVSRHEDVKPLLSDPRMSMNARTAGRGYPGFRFPPALNEHLLNVDAADHARIRRLISKAFTPRRIAALEERIQQTTGTLLDAIAPNGKGDLLNDLAVPLPIEVISGVLGIPSGDSATFRRFTSTLMDPSAQARAARPAVVAEMHEFFTALVERKRSQPGGDLFSAMLEAGTGEQLSANEMTSLAFQILWAGFETTVYAIATAISLALTHPRAADVVRAQPSPRTPAMDALVEEILRIEGPLLTAIRRFPTQDIEVAGRTIPAGSTVLLAISSANRDPDAFDRPDVLDVDRPSAAHLAFGHGPHYCLGASLARTEIRTAIWSLLHRFPDAQLSVPRDQLAWKPDYRQHALTSLSVTFTAQPTQ